MAFWNGNHSYLLRSRLLGLPLCHRILKAFSCDSCTILGPPMHPTRLGGSLGCPGLSLSQAPPPFSIEASMNNQAELLQAWCHAGASICSQQRGWRSRLEICCVEMIVVLGRLRQQWHCHGAVCHSVETMRETLHGHRQLYKRNKSVRRWPLGTPSGTHTHTRTKTPNYWISWFGIVTSYFLA